MNLFLHSARLSLCLLTLSAPAMATGRTGQVLRSAEAQALRARCDPALGSLRGGTVDRNIVLQAGERAALRSAESQSPGLAEMRAGNGVGTVLAVVLIVLLVLLIV